MLDPRIALSLAVALTNRRWKKRRTSSKATTRRASRDYDRVVQHILGMADVLSNGIIAQFPSKFSGK